MTKCVGSLSWPVNCTATASKCVGVSVTGDARSWFADGNSLTKRNKTVTNHSRPTRPAKQHLTGKTDSELILKGRWTMSLNLNRPVRPAGTFVIFALAIAFLLFSTLLLAQTNVGNGSIQGTITDPSGAVVSGAKVTITEKSKGTSVIVSSDSRGSYSSG